MFIICTLHQITWSSAIRSKGNKSRPLGRPRCRWEDDIQMGGNGVRVWTVFICSRILTISGLVDSVKEPWGIS
jgi:hypothetical protein